MRRFKLNELYVSKKKIKQYSPNTGGLCKTLIVIANGVRQSPLLFTAGRLLRAARNDSLYFRGFAKPSTDHPDGGSKAKFFINFGFTLANWQVFAQAIREQAANHSVKSITETAYGTKHVIDGVIETPAGKNVLIRTVWMIRTNKNKAELITAHPL